MTGRGAGGEGFLTDPYHSGMNSHTHPLADYLAVAVEAARLGAAELERWRKHFK